jgi:hypothetical protein
VNAGFGEKRDELGNEELTVVIVIKNVAPFNSAHNNVLKKPGNV